jgi:hypothetical protein
MPRADRKTDLSPGPAALVAVEHARVLATGGHLDRACDLLMLNPGASTGRQVTLATRPARITNPPAGPGFAGVHRRIIAQVPGARQAGFVQSDVGRWVERA